MKAGKYLFYMCVLVFIVVWISFLDISFDSKREWTYSGSIEYYKAKDGHDYIIFDGFYSGNMVHSEGCKHTSHFKQP